MRSTCSSPAREGLRRGIALLLALAVPLSACGPLSIQDEKRLGSQFAREARREFHFVRDRVIANYVREIGEELVRAAGPQPFTYRFYVIDDDDANAFAAPAGYIYIHTGTILRSRSVSELAGVMAHEVGHVARRHIANNYNRQKNTGLFYQLFVVAAWIFAGGYAGQAASVGGGLAAAAWLNTFSRDDERDADAFAVSVLPKANYDPNGLVTFFEMIQKEYGGGGGFLSSHPAPAERIQNTRAMIQALGLDQSLRRTDGGKLEIIQRRIKLITGVVDPSEPEKPESEPEPEPVDTEPTPL